MELFNATGGENWRNCSWQIASSQGVVCNWPCLECSDCAVTAILLASKNLKGTIPPSLASLTQLRKLDLSINAIWGTVPSSLAALTTIEELRIAQTRLGPHPGLSGSLPSWLSSLTSLELVHHSECRFSGTFPSQLASLTLLKMLTLNINAVSGQLPAELSRLTQLRDLFLGHNDFLSGTLSPTFSAFTSLRALDIAKTQLSGSSSPGFSDWIGLRGFLADRNAVCVLITIVVHCV